MVLLSLLVGMPIDGKWYFIFQFEFIYHPKTIFIYHTDSFMQMAAWATTILAHFGVLILQFII